MINLSRAFVLVFLNKVELVTSYKHFKLHSVNQEHDAPAVIRLLKYVNVPYKGVTLVRQNVFKRDGFECAYCSSTKNLTLDHVKPRAQGGKSEWTNLITACKRCNTVKGDRTPIEAGMVMNKQPFKPGYSHFVRDFSGYLCDEWQPFLVRKGRVAI